MSRENWRHETEKKVWFHIWGGSRRSHQQTVKYVLEPRIKGKLGVIRRNCCSGWRQITHSQCRRYVRWNVVRPKRCEMERFRNINYHVAEIDFFSAVVAVAMNKKSINKSQKLFFHVSLNLWMAFCCCSEKKAAAASSVFHTLFCLHPTYVITIENSPV